MGPQKELNSPKSSDREGSSGESIISISTALLNPPPEFLEARRLEGMSKDSRIPQYVQEKLQEARELLFADIDCIKSGNTLPPESDVKIGRMTNISLKINEGELGAFCPSANERNNGHLINTTNDHLVEIPEIGGVTNHHENIAPSPNLDTQEATTVPIENISTETQRKVAEDEIVLTQTNAEPSMDSSACSLTLTPSHSCMKIILENENRFDYILISYHVFKSEDWITWGVRGLLVCSADYRISSAKGTLQLLEITSILKKKESLPDEDIWKRTNKYICEILHESFFSKHSSSPICPSKYRLAEYLALDFSEAWQKKHPLESNIIMNLPKKVCIDKEIQKV
ncbi:hypothetical protein O181_060743 [Austropuccinia psidii MF-1]|uniref:Uncharacterized protein n=1 Tax=Austropuccinia psidii MF-1 TaxID=1389203 RepID=A0A9Q3EGZ1_9BASI|nr:hypothetical protein [Austropuccinia psidii MF-1]